MPVVKTDAAFNAWLRAVSVAAEGGNSNEAGQYYDTAQKYLPRWRAIYLSGVTPADISNPPYWQVQAVPQGEQATLNYGYTGNPSVDFNPSVQALVAAGYLVWSSDGPGSTTGTWTMQLPPHKWPGTTGADNIMHDPGSYIDPGLFAFDPFYGLVTPAANYRQSKGWAMYDAFSQSLPKILISPAIGGVTELLDIGAIGAAGVESGSASVDELDFLDTSYPLLNNNPGTDFGAADWSADWVGNLDNPDNYTVDDWLSNDTTPAYSDATGDGVLQPTDTGVNTVGDSANLTDEPGSVSNANGIAPKGGGTRLGSGQNPGQAVASPNAPLYQTSPIPYLPPNPRNLQSAAQALFNPQGGGLYPITNPSANPGTGSIFGTGNQPSVSQKPFVGQAGYGAGLSSQTMLLIGVGVVALILMVK